MNLGCTDTNFRRVIEKAEQWWLRHYITYSFAHREAHRKGDIRVVTISTNTELMLSHPRPSNRPADNLEIAASCDDELTQKIEVTKINSSARLSPTL